MEKISRRNFLKLTISLFVGAATSVSLIPLEIDTNKFLKEKTKHL